MALTEIPVELSSTPGIADSSNATAITIDSSEQVGIGTGSPSTSLDIVRAGVQPLRLESSSGTEVAINMVNTGGNVQLEAHSGNFVIDADAVGIGETSPNALLAVGNGNQSHTSVASFAHSTDAYIEVENTTTQNGAGIIFTNAGTKKWTIQKDTSSHGLFVQEASDTTVMAIDQSGNVTMPLQPAFLVRLGGSPVASNLATNTHHTLVFNNEVYDVGGNFNDGSSGTPYSFAAPVTGKYQLNVYILLIDMPDDSDYVYMTLNTSNRVYQTYFDAGGLDQDSAAHTLNLSVVADMDANDKAYIQLKQQGGTAQMDLNTESYFSGYLVA